MTFIPEHARCCTDPACQPRPIGCGPGGCPTCGGAGWLPPHEPDQVDPGALRAVIGVLVFLSGLALGATIAGATWPWAVAGLLLLCAALALLDAPRG